MEPSDLLIEKGRHVLKVADIVWLFLSIYFIVSLAHKGAPSVAVATALPAVPDLGLSSALNTSARQQLPPFGRLVC